MRRHLELGLILCATTLALGGAACSREADQNATYPQAQPVPVSYSEAAKTSMTNQGAAPNAPKAGVGYDAMEKEEGAPMPSKSSSTTMDNGGYDQSGVPSTGSKDNVPSGIGGGPMDKGAKTFKPGAANDSNTDDSLSPDKGPDKGKDKGDEAKPEAGKAKANGKASTGKSGTTGSGSTGGASGTPGGAGGSAGGAGGAGAGGGGAGGK